MIILMENSKNATRSLYAKGPLFFNIGLIISITLCFIAFEFKVHITDEETVVLPEDPGIIIVMTDVKRTVQPPKVRPELIKPKKEILPNIVDKEPPVKNDTKELAPVDIEEINNAMDADGPPEEIVEDNTPYLLGALEVKPEYKGGMDAFYKFLSEEIKYPRREQQRNIGGKVYLSFVIEKDGSLSDITVLKGVSEGLDQEAIRVLKAAPAWNPGKQRGQPVRVKMTIPITFQLN
ncbi:biopolymer transporter TonB [Marivirga lumbricoides]|uniref:Biopolymer transporter TonB n=2 Tax=Marivirga lumbricoides TaxID=1046115 RepID=A0ABQ1MCY0_9BACT|nr:biopolymer transporter TonB [Marivirga lumbricoides]